MHGAALGSEDSGFGAVDSHCNKSEVHEGGSPDVPGGEARRVDSLAHDLLVRHNRRGGLEGQGDPGASAGAAENRTTVVAVAAVAAAGSSSSSSSSSSST